MFLEKEIDMKTLKNISLLLILLVFTTFPSLTYATHSWGTYHWARTENPFTLKLGDNVSLTWDSSLGKTSEAWSDSQVLNTTIAPGLGGRNCKAQTGRVEVCNGKYGNNGWLGLAQIWISTSHITAGLAKMNDTYFNTSKYNNPNEKLHVMCQEVAHAFGLDHQSTDGSSQNSCMDYFSNTGANATSILSTGPNEHDFYQLNTIYAHFDSTTTVAAMTALAASASEVTNDPNSWGQLMSQSANGRSSAYERFHADGSQTITHVYWTIEAAANCPACDHRHDH
jgi:hypothetical protein